MRTSNKRYEASRTLFGVEVCNAEFMQDVIGDDATSDVMDKLLDIVERNGFHLDDKPRLLSMQFHTFNFEIKGMHKELYNGDEYNIVEYDFAGVE